MNDAKEIIKLLIQLYSRDQQIDYKDYIKRLSEWINFFKLYWNILIEPVKKDILENYTVKINYEELLELDVPPNIETFKKEFYLTPEIQISLILSSVHFILICDNLESIKSSSDPDNVYCGIENKLANVLVNNNIIGNISLNELNKRLRLNLINYKPIVKFNDLRSNLINCLTSVVGQIIKISKPKNVIKYSLFKCDRCGACFFKCFPTGTFALPSKCVNEQCVSRFFTIKKNNAITSTHQIIKIQEYDINNNYIDNIKNNSTLDIQINDSQIGLYNLGNVINVIGVIKINSTNNNLVCNTKFNNYTGNSYNDNKLVYKLFIDTISVNIITNTTYNNYINSNNKNKDNDNSNSFINEIYYNEPNKFYLLASSLFHNLNGKHYQKVGILLSLFNSNANSASNNSNSNDRLKLKRTNSHVLMIGEPGVGKSHMLLNVSSLGYYIISGSNITNSGLTIGVVKDGSNEYNLESGLLVLFNNSILCIDELDKLNNPNMLLEVMEEQKVSVAKGGIVKRLNAKTTLICALNPISSKFNFAKSLLDNIKISSTLVSRFDLVFLLINDKNDYNDYFNTRGSGGYLADKLQAFSKYDYLNPVLINEYIEYGKKYINPSFTKESKKILKQFISHLIHLYSNKNNANVNYQNGHGEDVNGFDSNASANKLNENIKLTIRQIHGLIRLCNNRAKADLMNTITCEHVEEVIELFKNTIYYPPYLHSLYSNVTVVPQKEKKVGKAKVVKIFINELRKLLNNQRGVIPNSEMHKLATDIIEANKSSFQPEELIFHVNDLGYILKQGSNWKTNL